MNAAARVCLYIMTSIKEKVAHFLRLLNVLDERWMPEMCVKQYIGVRRRRRAYIAQ